MYATSQSGSGSHRNRARLLPMGDSIGRLISCSPPSNCPRMPGVIGVQHVGEKIQLRRGQSHGLQQILCMQVREQNPPATIRNQQRTVERIQQARNQLKCLLAA